MSPLRRGMCPGIHHPMQAGDGLLVRWRPPAPIPIDTFIAVCDAVQLHGNGVVEVTQRGSLQIRGLSPASATEFATSIVALGFSESGGPPILTAPLLGRNGPEHVDVGALIGELRSEFERAGFAARISPKVSVLIDGNCELHLDHVPADLRVRIGDARRIHLSLAGNATSAQSLGWVESHRAVEVLLDLLNRIASRGPDARARDLTNDAELRALHGSMAHILTSEPPPVPRPRAEPIGTHRLSDGRIARGVAVPFGHSTAGVLRRFAQTAARCGAVSIQPAPERALIAIGLPARMADDFAAQARDDGFLVQPDDVRRYVIACPGAPACGSATLATRRLAPAVAHAAQSFLDGSVTIHLSGCAKGCAHPGAAALTLVGPDRLVLQGRAGDEPHGRIAPETLIAGLRRFRAALAHSDEQSADMLSRLGASRVIESLGAEPPA